MEAEKIDWLDGYDPVAAGDQNARGVSLATIRQRLRMTPEQRLDDMMPSIELYVAVINERPKSQASR